MPSCYMVGWIVQIVPAVVKNQHNQNKQNGTNTQMITKNLNNWEKNGE